MNDFKEYNKNESGGEYAKNYEMTDEQRDNELAENNKTTESNSESIKILMERVPEAPTTVGTYVLTATVTSSGSGTTVAFTWESTGE